MHLKFTYCIPYLWLALRELGDRRALLHDEFFLIVFLIQSKYSVTLVKYAYSFFVAHPTPQLVIPTWYQRWPPISLSNRFTMNGPPLSPLHVSFTPFPLPAQNIVLLSKNHPCFFRPSTTVLFLQILYLTNGKKTSFNDSASESSFFSKSEDFFVLPQPTAMPPEPNLSNTLKFFLSGRQSRWIYLL